MGNKGKIKYIFASSNTKNGFYTFIPDLINELRKVYILKGPAGSGKSTFIRLLGEALCEQGYEIEFWISSIDPLNPDGVYIPQLEVAVVNGSLPRPVDPRFPGGIEEIINLGEFLDKEATNAQREVIENLVLEVNETSKQAYYLLKQAGRVKHEIKNITSKHLNIEKIQGLINSLAEEILNNQPREKHYFASALTADGMINYIDDISSECRKRYVFKGPSGSAKSTIINELASIFKEKGFIIEYYHSGFDVESIDMVIIRNLQIALIDGGSAELSLKPWDVIVDMTALLKDYEINTADMLSSESYRNYEKLILEAQAKLDNMRRSLKDLKKVYSSITDFEMLDEKRQKLRMEIMER